MSCSKKEQLMGEKNGKLGKQPMETIDGRLMHGLV